MADEPPIDLTAERKKRKAKSTPTEINDTPLETQAQHGGLMFTHMNNGKPLPTIENLEILLKDHGIICRYNAISKRNEMTIPGEEFTIDNIEPASLACVFSRMKEMLMPTDGYADYLIRIGDKNQYNPAKNLILREKWDGGDHIIKLADTLTVAPEHERMKFLLVRRWLITACALAMKENVDSAGCLVLQGAQGIGKTWWVRKLVPEKDMNELIRTGANLNPRDRDSLSQFIRYWIVELGEIGSTFRKVDIDALKAFITDDKDILRRPYGRGDQVYSRHTAMIASVNEQIYLYDTENRRFWTIPCIAVNSRHTVNMQQIWAETLHLLENGETWQLSDEEKSMVFEINKQHGQIDPIYEKILEKYNWSYECSDVKSATQIAEYLGLKNITQRETRLIGSYILKLNGNRREPNNHRRFYVPYVI